MVSTLSVKFALKDGLLTTTHVPFVGINFELYFLTTVTFLNSLGINFQKKNFVSLITYIYVCIEAMFSKFLRVSTKKSIKKNS